MIEDIYQSGQIDERGVSEYSLEPTTNAPVLYFLPKIYKRVLHPPSHTHTHTHNPHSGRPVVSSNGCPTEKSQVH